MVHEIFAHALGRSYAPVKARHPTEGRRKWRLRALYEAWPALPAFQPANFTSPGPPAAAQPQSDDADPMDEFLADGELGILVRTDFSDEPAWEAFAQKVRDAQADLVAELASGGGDADADVPMDDAQPSAPVGEPSTSAASAPAADSDDDADSDTDSTTTPDIISILDPSDPAERSRFNGISNLTALRLFNDVDIRPAPAPPAGIKRVSPPSPLVDQGGWQEIYTGKTLWIYDARSNVDECARLVSQEGDFYGTATGDSWRARAAHIPEMQFSMIYQGMKIDFNGLDKYDWSERARNLAECTTL
ncbi:hypothetical protein HYPSUDRAFT_178731 [Hypholoma sublateritium FD-334 SS-4]|uniref:Uncharacterized protein n=1 Tax=Hypholoma sublateritium (strain FD-334 SS-4) TaxID=945553 RepID=A0A0D2Q7G7_HYPSF|nr:hypothetical protein HYPSUDRAFT_178731 [Hypholoma sublateritium FD-334 SS-4]